MQRVQKRIKGPAPSKEIGYDQTGIVNLDNVDEKDKKIKGILNKFEDRIFVGKTKAFNVYKMFDVDGDGN